MFLAISTEQDHKLHSKQKENEKQTNKNYILYSLSEKNLFS